MGRRVLGFKGLRADAGGLALAQRGGGGVCLSPGRLCIALPGRVDAGFNDFKVLETNADAAAIAQMLARRGITAISVTPDGTMITERRRFARTGMTRIGGRARLPGKAACAAWARAA